MKTESRFPSPGVPPIAVLGAAGHTGRFVAAELLRRGRPVLLLGRDAGRLARIRTTLPPGLTELRCVDLADPASLDSALRGAAAVLHCAGPFLETAPPVMEAALRARLPYLDLTAEQPCAVTAFADYDAKARAAGVALLPAMGFYGGLGDLLATAALGDWERADAIQIGIALDRWWPTEGTRATGRRNTARRLVLDEGELVPLAEAPAPSWTFVGPFGRQEMVELPFTETILLGRHRPAPTVRNYLNRTALDDIRNPATPPPSPADAAGRSAQRFAVEAVVRRAGETRLARVSGRDIYAVTAPLVVEAVTRLLALPRPPAGAFAPSELFPPADFLRALSPDHLHFEPTTQSNPTAPLHACH